MAVAFTGMMLLSGVTMLAPTASAAGIKSVAVYQADLATQCNSIASHCMVRQIGSTNYPIVKVGDSVSVTLAGAVDTSGCTAASQATPAPAVSVWIDYTQFAAASFNASPTATVSMSPGGASAGPTDTATTWYFTATQTLQMPTGSTRSVENAAQPFVGVTYYVSASCPNGVLLSLSDNSGSGSFNQTFVVDNQLPGGTFTINLLSGTGGLGSHFSVSSIGAVNKSLFSAQFDLGQINTSTQGLVAGGTTGNVFSASSGSTNLNAINNLVTTSMGDLLTSETKNQRPLLYVNLTDLSGNVAPATLTLPTNGFDLLRPPSFLQMPTLAPANSPSLNVSFHILKNSIEADNLTLNITDITSGSPATNGTLTCRYSTPSATCGRVWNFTGSTDVTQSWWINDSTSYHLVSDHTYAVSVALFDGAGNTNAWQTPVAATTNPLPLGDIQLTLPGGKTRAGIGDTITLTPHPGTFHDIFRASVGTVNVSADGAHYWEYDNVAHTWNYTNPQTVTIAATGQQTPSVPVLLYGNNSLVGFGRLVDASGTPYATVPIDTLAPAPVSSVSATPSENGYVNVTFTASSDTDVASYSVLVTNTGTNAQQTISCSPVPGPSQMCTWAGPHDEQTYAFQVRGIDTAGNLGALYPTVLNVTAPSSLHPVSVQITQLNGATSANNTKQYSIPAFSGTWSGPTLCTGSCTGWTNLSIAIASTAGNSSWFAGKAVANGWSPTPYLFPVHMNGDGTWSATNFTTSGANATDASTIPDGRYMVQMNITDPPHHLNLTQNLTFTLERAPPAFATAPKPAFFPAASDITLMQQMTSLTVWANASAPLSGVTSLTYTLVTPSFGPVTSINGGPVSITRTNGTAAAGGVWSTPSIPAQTLAFGSVPVGDYRLNVTATNGAGNTNTMTLDGTLHSRPRVVIDLSNPPTVDSTNNMSIKIYAAEDRALSDGGGSCDQSTICRVSQVEIFVHTIGSTSSPTSLGAVTIPKGTVTKAYDQVTPLYDYSPPNRVTIGSFDRNTTEVSVVATGTDPSGASVTAQTPWIAVSTTDVPASDLTIAWPQNNWDVLMPNATAGGLPVNVTFARANLASAPTLYYWLNDTVNGTTLSAAGATLGLSGSAAPLYYWNTSSLTPTQPGEYSLAVIANYGSGSRTVTRYFGYETRSPTLDFSSTLTQPEIQNGAYVKGEFNISANVTTYFANLSPTDVKIDLFAGSPTYHKLTQGVDYNATVTSIAPLAGGAWSYGSVWSYNVTVDVQPPAGLHDGDRFDLWYNVSSDSAPLARALANASALRTIIVDLAAPVPTLDLAETQASANHFGSASDELKIIGLAPDSQSGTRKVEVNLYDVTHNQTFVWNDNINGGWEGGDSGSWMTSDVVHAQLRPGVDDINHGVRNVYVQTIASTGQTFFFVNNTDRPRFDDKLTTRLDTNPYNSMGLDPGATYRLRIRATDAMGFVGTNETTFHMDAVAPVMAPTFTMPDFGGWIPGTGNFGLAANASDNYCVATILLHGVSPLTGSSLSAPFVAPANRACGSNPPTTTQWTLDLANAPQMRYEPGVWTYWLEARDGAGNNVTTQPIHLYVRDDLPPVSSIQLQPATIGQGSTTRIVVNAQDNWRVTDVLLNVYAQGNATPLKTIHMAPDATNPPTALGVGNYSADLATDLGLNLPLGNYTFDVVARDGNRTASCTECLHATATLKVVTEAPPDIRFEKPGEAARYVGAAPSFQIRITGTNLTTGGVSIKAGTNGSLAPVTPTLAFQAGSNNSVLLASFAASGLNDGDTYSVNVTVTTTSGFVAQDQHDLTVDTVPPKITATPSGNSTVGGVEWAGGRATLTLAANDTGSGVAGITYSVNGGAPQAYRGPISIAGADGAWRVDYAATDAAGNAAHGTYSVVLDATGPSIGVLQSGATINVTVTDRGVGVQDGSVKLAYAIGAGSSFQTLTMTRVDSTNIYSGTVPGDLSGGFSYYVTARDLLGNTGSNGTASAPNVVNGGTSPGPGENTPPTVKIVTPAQGDSLRDSVNIQYVAHDLETPDSQLKITISLRLPDGTGQNVVTNADNSGSYVMSAAGLASGQYTLVVRASDGDKAGTDQVTFSLVAAPRVVSDPLPLTSAANQPVPMAVQFNAGKTVQQATWTASKDGQPFANGTMRLVGGKYVASFTPTQPGTYTLAVSATYTDLTSDPTPTTLGTVTVAGSGPSTPAAGGGLPASFLVLVVLALATIALAAYGAFVRWRK